MKRRRAMVRRAEEEVGLAPPQDDGGAAKFGLVAIGASAVVGGLIGSATTDACGAPGASNLCGPAWGGVRGALWGTALTGLAGLAVASISKDWRRTGFTTAGLGLGAFLGIGAVSGVVKTMVGK